MLKIFSSEEENNSINFRTESDQSKKFRNKTIDLSLERIIFKIN